MKLWHILATIVIIGLIASVGFWAMRLMPQFLPVASDSIGVSLLFTIIIIALGLAVPYWILKAGIHTAHLHNPEEDELEMKDIPRDAHDMAHKHSPRP